MKEATLCVKYNYQTIRKLREERDYWYMMARKDSASLARTLAKVREVENELKNAQEKPKENQGKTEINHD